MDAVKEFFQKYHAVAATDAGPQWETASDDALLGWLTGECSLLRHGTGDPKRTILNGALAEVWSRIGRLAKECSQHGTDWPGRNSVGRLLAALAVNADVLRVAIRRH